MERLFYIGPLVKAEPRVDFRRDFAWYNAQDLAPKLHKQVVESGIGLLIEILSMTPAIRHCLIDELGVFGLLGCGENEGRVGCRILWFVFGDRGELAGVTHNNLQRKMSVFAYAM
jgi:hypothetical protein